MYNFLLKYSFCLDFQICWYGVLCKIFFFLIAIQLLYSVVLISAVQQRESVMAWKSLSRVQLCNPREFTSAWNSPGQNTGVGSLSLLQGSSQPRDRIQVSCIAGDSLPAEPRGKQLCVCACSPWASLPAPRQPHPLSRPRAEVSSCAVRRLPTCGGDKCQCHARSSSRPASARLSQRLCLCPCLTNRFINTSHLDSMYVRNYTILIFLLLTWLYPVWQTLGSAASLELIQICSFSRLSNITLHVSATRLLSPFICCWAFSLLPCPGYRE